MIAPIRRLLSWEDPSQLANALCNRWGRSGFIWLDGDGSDLGRWIILGTDPIDQIYCYGLPENPNSSNPFDTLKTLYPGHWTGWLSYEAGAWIEPSNPWKSHDMATLWIGCHDPVFKFDLQEHQLWLEGSNEKRINKITKWLSTISLKKENQPQSPTNNISNFQIPISAWKWVANQKEYSKNVEKIKTWIASGDIFQANLTTSCSTKLPDGIIALDIFQKLRTHCPSPFGGLIMGAGNAADEAIISTSPERFLKALPTGEVESRPIKGTRPRHINPNQDADLAAELISSIKDRAENVMIVDLLRNDLGRVCRPGSITVPQLVGLETYSKVHHLTSVVKGHLQDNQTWVDLLAACWPGGSISGAPKLRACQRLSELEPMARGPYCGSLIHIDWDGHLDSNILIRSMLLKGKQLTTNAGCGIVADSDPMQEAEELNWKLMPLLQALA